MNKKFLLLHGDANKVLKTLPEKIFHTCITSPPYWQLRDYFVNGQLGREATPEEYVENLVTILRKVKRVLRNDGTLWLNIGDGYNTKNFKHSDIKKKEVIGMPWRVAFALQKDGWYLRSDIIWEKSNPLPDGAKDRPTKAHEFIFLLSKRPKYFYDYYATLEDTREQPVSAQKFGARNQRGTFRHDQDREFEHYGKRNKRNVWTTSVGSYKGDHFAIFPEKLITPCVLASTSEKGCCPGCGSPWKRDTKKIKVPSKNEKGYKVKLISCGWSPTCKCGIKETQRCMVLDPFSGMATTGIVAMDYFNYYVGIEINESYLRESRQRLIGEEIFIREVPNLEGFTNVK